MVTQRTSTFGKDEIWMTVEAALCRNSTTSCLSQYNVHTHLSGFPTTFIYFCFPIMQPERTTWLTAIALDQRLHTLLSLLDDHLLSSRRV